jgi:hypothetical protein
MIHKTLKLTIASTVMLMMTSIANAAWFVGTINRIQMGSDSHLVVYVDAPAAHECGSYRLDFSDSNAPGFKYVYAALLAWQAQEKKIQFAIIQCSGTNGVFSHVEDLK